MLWISCRSRSVYLGLITAAVLASASGDLRAQDIQLDYARPPQSAEALTAAEAVVLDDDSVSSDAASYMNQQTGSAPACRCCDCYPSSEWNVFFTQTVDYGTNLVLPINLDPAQSFLSSFAGPNSGQYMTQSVIGSIGLLDSLGGLLPFPAPVSAFQDDFQFQTNTGLQRTTKLSDTGSFMGGYTYYQSLHPSVEQLNLVAHNINAQYQDALTDLTTITFNYNFAYYFLDSDSFLSQNAGGVGLLRQYGDLWAGELRGDYLNSNFRGADTLNSNTYFAKVAAYRYRSAENHTDYLTLGYLGGYSDAEALFFSYVPNTVYAGSNWHVGSSGKNQVRTIFSYGNYNFQAATPTLPPSPVRNDNLYIFNLWFGHQWNDHLLLFASYYMQSNHTNIPGNTYTENLISTGLNLNY